MVGGKGRPRRTAEQQAAHVAARQAAEATLAAMSPTYRRRQQHQQLLREAACSPPGAAAQQQPADGATAALPGWGPPPEREWRVAGGGGGKRGRRAQQRAAEQTPEQQVAALAAQVQELAAQLAGAPVYASLTAAMAAAAAAVPGQQQQQEQQPEGQQQQHLQQQHLQQQQWDWSGVQQLVVYGLGSPEDSRVSRHQVRRCALLQLRPRLFVANAARPCAHGPRRGCPPGTVCLSLQLALVLLLRRLLPGLTAAPALYDPAFTPLDAQLLAALGLALIPLNEQGRRPAAAPTLFYLPHCEVRGTRHVCGARACSSCLLAAKQLSVHSSRWQAETPLCAD